MKIGIKSNILLVALALAASVAMAAPPPGAKSPQTAPGGKSPQTASAADRQVKPVNAAQLEQVLQTTRGKVTLVNFWATWCDSCVKEFPDVVRLYNKHKNQGMDIVFVSADSLDTRDKKVIPFLKKQGVNFTTYIVNQDVDSFVNAIDKSWEGACPRTYLLDREGKIRKIITGAINPAQVDALLRQLIAEHPGASRTAAARPNPKGFLAQ